MNCPECGGPADGLYCGHCGAKLYFEDKPENSLQKINVDFRAIPYLIILLVVVGGVGAFSLAKNFQLGTADFTSMAVADECEQGFRECYEKCPVETECFCIEKYSECRKS
jgi:hypothetical protein